MNSMFDSELKKIKDQARSRARMGTPDALVQASDLVKRYPGEVEAWMWRAHIHQMSKNYGEAIDDLTTALGLSPTEPYLFFNRGRYYMYLGDYQCAIDDFTQGLAACDLHKNDSYREMLHFFRADAYLRCGDKAAAFEDLKRVREDFTIWTTKLCSKQGLLELCSTDCDEK